ncbi:S41 family peptidase [Nocardioides sp. SYSU D00065]|uniref:S41 family peptidase n=1 Tax=Nocardioides sp. SYSU D00065 TaxID=2817378 RepID=UPI001B3392CD|nr:S41 family peptidase [Nocardioides sp. SYSU D00065]
MDRRLLDRLGSELRERYVVPNAGARAADAVDRAATAGAWAGLSEGGLAGAVTELLQQETGDRHLQLRFSADRRDPSVGDEWADPDFLSAYWAEQDHHNQGIHRAERLPGNVGLVVIESLDEPEGTGPVVDAALSFLGRCAALVLDVRVSNGGAPTGVAHLVSHFVEPPTRKILDVLDRDGAVVLQTWTQTHLGAPRFTTQPVYVLTSSRTPSGTEELAYDLQAMGRAVVVGETTVGAAHPVESVVVDPHFVLRLPTQRVVVADTGTSWEGTGVVPDVPCEAAVALAVAHRLAAERLLASGTTVPQDVRRELEKVARGELTRAAPA